MKFVETRGGRPLALTVLGVLTLGIAGCGDDGPFGVNGFEAQASFSFDIEVTTQTSWRLRGINGQIDVIGVPGLDVIELDGVRRVTSDSRSDAENHLADVRVLIDVFGSEIVIETDQPSGVSERSYIVDYELRVPSDLVSMIVNANGEITVLSLDNTVSVSNANGNIRVDDTVGSVLVQNGNGNVECEAALPANGTIDLITGNGNINLFIPTSTSALFSANVGNGSITVSNLTLQDQVTTEGSVSGTLGGGQGDIALVTGNGNIVVLGI